MAKASEGGRVRKLLTKVSNKIGLGQKNSSSETLVSKKSLEKAEQNSKKYAKIDDVEEYAYQVLLDLGLVGRTK